jgi:hypothetical protein
MLWDMTRPLLTMPEKKIPECHADNNYYLFWNMMRMTITVQHTEKGVRLNEVLQQANLNLVLILFYCNKINYFRQIFKT